MLFKSYKKISEEKFINIWISFKRIQHKTRFSDTPITNHTETCRHSVTEEEEATEYHCDVHAIIVAFAWCSLVVGNDLIRLRNSIVEATISMRIKLILFLFLVHK